MPDFDVDFCMERPRPGHRLRGRALRPGCASPRSSPSAPWRRRRWCAMWGGCMGYPYGFVDQIAKLIPFELGMTLDRALEEERGSQEGLPGRRGSPGHHGHGQEAGGPGPQRGQARGRRRHRADRAYRLHPPLLRTRRGEPDHPVRQGRCGEVGLVKFDFLGLRTLTIIDWALETINAARGWQGRAAGRYHRHPDG